MPSKKTMKGHEQLCSFSQICGFILVFPIVSDRDSRFTYSRQHHGKRWNRVEALTMLHPWEYGQTEVINITLVQFLWGYIWSYMWSWDEQVVYIQHSYKWALHVSTWKYPLKLVLIFWPRHPLTLFMDNEKKGSRKNMKRWIEKSNSLRILNKSTSRYRINL